MNFEGKGEPLFKISNPSKNTKEKAKESVVKLDKELMKDGECEYCFKVISKTNRARHRRYCPVLKKVNNINGRMVYAHLKNPQISTYTEKIDTEGDEKIEHMPKLNQYNVLYVSGMSGSGKSFYTMQWANRYHELHKKNPIYIFSHKPEDKESLDKIKKYKRVKFSDEFLKTEFSISDFANSLLIFDDIDSIPDPIVLRKLYALLDMCLTLGRSYKVSTVYTTHTPTNGAKTKLILAENHSCTLFFHKMGLRPLKYICENYYGLDNKQIQYLRKLPSRWVTIFRSTPMIALHENGAIALNEIS